MTTIVQSAKELADAIANGAKEIVVQGTITGSPMITLPPGCTLRGGTLVFGAKGVRLTSNNTLRDITIRTAEDEVAILNDTRVETMGTLSLTNVRTTGQVMVLADRSILAGHVQIESLKIDRADVRGRDRRPHGFGVEALEGALTIWNRQADENVVITAEVLDVSVGSKDHPIRGSGIFVGGRGNWEGKRDGGILEVSTLRTGEVHTNGGIPEGTPDLISGGVFVISGAVVDTVRNLGPVTSYGPNDMVLDNWGEVRLWEAKAPITSHGPSGIGFVNLGDIDTLDIAAPITTTGKGARGFNLYDGSLKRASFASIETSGDGAIGIHISKPMGTLSVERNVSTAGGEGMSLVKGVQVPQKAMALCVRDGGSVEAISIGGALQTKGDGVTTLEVVGIVGKLSVAGGISASGKGSDAAVIHRDVPGFDDIKVTSASGRTIIRVGS